MTGGFPGWERAVEACAASGADAIEIGIPFSDPVMDGPTIQEASERALADGATPQGIIGDLRSLDAADVPLVVMTYYNTVHRYGHERFARSLVDVGVTGAIVPDLPLEEVGPWAEAADGAGVETILLAAPTGSDERLARICAALPRVGLRRRPAGCDRRAGLARPQRARHRPPAQGGHRQAGARRHRGV